MKKFNTPGGLFRRTQALLLIAVFALMAGCSTVRFTYNQGDTLLYWWINSYVDLEGRQADIVRRDIDRLFAWHRQTQLPDYAALLNNFQRQLAGNITQADLIAAYREIRARTELTAYRAVPEMVTLAMSLRPEQLAQMERKFISKNEEFRRKNLTGSLEKRQRARFKKSLEQFELWFGNFSDEQEAALRIASDARPMDSEIWLDERMYRQRLILATLREIQQQKMNRQQATAAIQALLRQIFSRIESPERKTFYDRYTDSTTRYIMTAIRLATPAQKAHAQQQMQRWIEDFRALSTARR